MATAPKLFIVYYSMYGHIATMAAAVAKGARQVDGVQVQLYRVAETLPADVLAKMGAPAADESVPVLNPLDLAECDGFLMGIPTRFGMMPAQWKAFWDRTGGLWAKGALAGKLGGMFHSTATLNGGQETTGLTAITQLAHHGVLYVPIGFVHPTVNITTEVTGGSPYGAGTVTGSDGSRQPSQAELDCAEFQGKTFAEYLLQFHRGKQQ